MVESPYLVYFYLCNPQTWSLTSKFLWHLPFSQNVSHTLMYIIPRNEGLVPQKLLEKPRGLHENTNSDHGLKIIFPFSPHQTTWAIWRAWFFVAFFSQNQPICYFFVFFCTYFFINYLHLLQQNPSYEVVSVVQMNPQKFFLVIFLWYILIKKHTSFNKDPRFTATVRG